MMALVLRGVICAFTFASGARLNASEASGLGQGDRGSECAPGYRCCEHVYSSGPKPAACVAAPAMCPDGPQGALCQAVCQGFRTELPRATTAVGSWVDSGRCASQASADHYSQTGEFEYSAIHLPWTVKLLVTRHGLSCTNFVEALYPSDWGRGKIADPSLTGLGVGGCDAAREELEEKGHAEPDAVVSSVLLRAIETALRLYDAGKPPPVYVVPHIHEKVGMFKSASNLPIDVEGQGRRFARAPGPAAAQRVDYSFLGARSLKDVAALTPDWEKFKDFVAREMLPKLSDRKRRSRPTSREISIAVVTHSNFFKETEAGALCKGHWEKHKKVKKPLNTQTFEVSYTWFPGSRLERGGGPCEELSAGLRWPLPGGQKPAFSRGDIGDMCRGPIREFAHKGQEILRRAESAP